MLHKDVDLRIVIVDDSKDEHFFIKSALSHYRNIRFKSLSSGEELLNYLLKQGVYHNSNRELPDIVIKDINIPKQRGFETFKKLNDCHHFNHISFVILSSVIEDIQDFGNLNLHCYKKPYALDCFREILEGIIENHLNTCKAI